AFSRRSLMECGGKRSATPLSMVREIRKLQLKRRLPDTLHRSSTVNGQFELTSPSPQPSPLGRGSLGHAFGDCESAGWSNDRKSFSLSPRERVGVRGKCAFDLSRAPSKIRVRSSRLPPYSINSR